MCARVGRGGDPSFAVTACSGWGKTQGQSGVLAWRHGPSSRVALNRRAGPIIVKQIEHRFFQSRSPAIVWTPELSDPV
jgi:hypothetical protein